MFRLYNVTQIRFSICVQTHNSIVFRPSSQLREGLGRRGDGLCICIFVCLYFCMFVYTICTLYSIYVSLEAVERPGGPVVVREEAWR